MFCYSGVTGAFELIRCNNKPRSKFVTEILTSVPFWESTLNDEVLNHTH